MKKMKLNKKTKEEIEELVLHTLNLQRYFQNSNNFYGQISDTIFKIKDNIRDMETDKWKYPYKSIEFNDVVQKIREGLVTIEILEILKKRGK
jgi:hypothetical protein